MTTDDRSYVDRIGTPIALGDDADLDVIDDDTRKEDT